MSDDIPLFEIVWDGEDVRNVVESVTRGSHWANGPYIDEFESMIEEYVDRDHAVVLNSGTTALVAALQAHGVGPGDEVIVPAFTFISTANAVELVDGDVVFADIERETYGLDPASVEAAVSESTAAIVPVHYAGKPCRIDELAEIADAHGLALIEDAAEALGATTDGRMVGSIGDSAVFSFCQNKIAAVGEGGAVVTDDEEVATSLRLTRSHGRASGEYFESIGGGEYVGLGSNYRMPDVVAAIGVAQMEKVEDLIDRRRRAAARLTAGLEPVDRVAPLTAPPNTKHIYQLYTVTFNPSVDRDRIAKRLGDAGIASKVYFEPVHHSRFYREGVEFRAGDLSVTEDVSERVLSLPIYPDITSESTDRIVDAVRSALDE